MNIEEQIDIIIQNFSELKKMSAQIQKAADIFNRTLAGGGKILICGNGGSASDAQHLAAELVVKYKKIRKGFPAIALTTDTSIITAIGNDIGADEIFARQVEAIGSKGDLLLGITTSGNSRNIINAIKIAQNIGIKTIALTGKTGGNIQRYADYTLNTPSDITNNIQEMHIAICHIICDILENTN